MQRSVAQITTATTIASAPQQPDDCVTKGAQYHGVNAWVLRAILKVESNFNPKAVNRNKNGTIDVGIAQYNSRNFSELKKFGISPDDLMDACVSSYIAAWHLKKLIRTYGDNWYAIGAYNSTTPCYNDRYSSLVWNTLLSWQVVGGRPISVHSLQSCEGAGQSRGVNVRTNQDASPMVAYDSISTEAQ